MRVFMPLIMVFALAKAQAGDIPDYPYPVQEYDFDSQRQELSMAYMDVQPGGDIQGTVVLLHGKNFNGAYWGQTIDFLKGRGYRVVVPDQVGFGRSNMPKRYQFTFDQLAANTKELLDYLDVDEVVLLGHSMGGMLATRFALLYPDMTEQLVMLNPIGLEDYRGMGVPYVDINSLFESELERTYEDIQSGQKDLYYDGEWKDRYEPWARLLAAHYEGEQGERFAWNMALTSDMVLSQPVVYEFDQLEVPTTLLIGTRDRTAIGRDQVDDDVAERMGDYTQLGKKTAERIPESTLVEFDDVGHMPHIEAPERYLEALGKQL